MGPPRGQSSPGIHAMPLPWGDFRGRHCVWIDVLPLLFPSGPSVLLQPGKLAALGSAPAGRAELAFTERG